MKAHWATLNAKECEVLAREQTLLQNEQRLTALLNQKDQEIASLQQLVSQLQQQQQFSRHDLEVAVKHISKLRFFRIAAISFPLHGK